MSKLLLIFKLILIYGVLSTPLFASLRKANSQFKKGLYTDAAINYYRLIERKKNSASVRLRAEWGLVLSLDKLGFNYSSTLYLTNILKRGISKRNPKFSSALNLLGRIDHRLGLGSGLILHILNENIAPERVPSDARGFFFYYRGVSSFLKKRYKSAYSNFQRVQPDSNYYLKAIYHLAVIANISGEHQQAINLFKKLQKIAKDESNDMWIKEQSNMNIARIYYELKQYTEAIKYYSQIPRQSQNWLQALFEAAWAFFIMEKANNTLGNIHTIQSPFFVNRFHPETYILQAITFLRMCRYTRVKETLALFKTKFSPVLKNLKVVLGKTKNNPENFFGLVFDYKTKKLDQYEEIWPILAQLSLNDSFNDAIQNIAKTESEVEQLSKVPSSWKTSGLERDLRTYLAKRKAVTITESGRLLHFQARGYGSYLVELSNQTRLITAELLLGKVDSIREKLNIKTAEKKENFIGGMQPLKIGEQLEYWPFEGEYWEDELGGYVFNINSKCNMSTN